MSHFADYDSNSIPENVTIPGNQMRACFIGDIVDDSIAGEPTENFFLTIVGVSRTEVAVVLNRTRISIMNDDCKSGLYSTLMTKTKYGEGVCAIKTSIQSVHS